MQIQPCALHFLRPVPDLLAASGAHRCGRQPEVSIEAPEMVNGLAGAAPVRVKFGPGKTQDIPLAWAEFMLGRMYEAQRDNAKPLPFGVLLAQAAMESR